MTMKKLILTVILGAFTASLVNAQQNKSASPEPVKSLSIQESNSLNGKSEPIMSDGKPYSQWVAEQKALKMKQNMEQQNKTTPVATGLSLVANNVVKDPAPERMNEPVQYGIKATTVQTTEDPNKVVVGTKQEHKQAIKPEVPEQFRLRTDAKWSTATTENKTTTTSPVINKEQDPANKPVTTVQPTANPGELKSGAELEAERKAQQAAQTPEVKKTN